MPEIKILSHVTIDDGIEEIAIEPKGLKWSQVGKKPTGIHDEKPPEVVKPVHLEIVG